MRLLTLMTPTKSHVWTSFDALNRTKMTGFLSQFGAAKRGHKDQQGTRIKSCFGVLPEGRLYRFDLDLAIFEDKTLMEYMGVSKSQKMDGL